MGSKDIEILHAFANCLINGRRRVTIIIEKQQRIVDAEQKAAVDKIGNGYFHKHLKKIIIKAEDVSAERIKYYFPFSSLSES